MKRSFFAVIISFSLAFALPVSAMELTTETPAAPATPVVADPVDVFLSQSAFIGNSVGEGLTMYNNAKGKAPLGNATMLTRVSYSFYADANSMSKYLPQLGGTPMRAKDAVKKCGASYVFISMGTNDLVGSASAEKAFANYQNYLAGIMTENPFVTIFIESCTPTRPGSNVNNDKVTAFNNYSRAYCDSFPNMFYVDIATPLKDESGYLSASLSSDGSVHLTNKAYAIWASTVRNYIAGFLAARLQAMHEEQEKEHRIAAANYQAAITKMEDKKQHDFEVRMQAKRDAEAKIEEQRRHDLLFVPDEVTLMRAFVAKEKKNISVAFAPAVAR